MIEDPDRGVLLLMNNEGEKAGLAKVSSEMIKALGAEVVLIEGEGGDDLNPAGIKSHPLILRVTDASDSKSSETSMNLYKMIQSKKICLRAQGELDPHTLNYLLRNPFRGLLVSSISHQHPRADLEHSGSKASDSPRRRKRKDGGRSSPSGSAKRLASGGSGLSAET